MIPKWHILLGAAFTYLIYISAPGTKIIYLALVFFSSFLIDFDHYFAAVIKTRKVGLINAMKYYKKLNADHDIAYKKGNRDRGDFHFMHTIEFHVLIGVLGIYFVPFLYIFMGMVFHSLSDLFYILYTGMLHRREYFFFNWLRKRF